MLAKIRFRFRTALRDGWRKQPNGLPGPASSGFAARVRDEWNNGHASGAVAAPRFGLADVLAGFESRDSAFARSAGSEDARVVVVSTLPGPCNNVHHQGMSESATDRARATLDHETTSGGPDPDVAGPSQRWQSQPGATSVDPAFTGRKRYSIGELTCFEDATFIDVAFHCVLKRPPDPAGCEHFLHRLRAAEVDRIDVLAALARSQEGRERHVAIDGLRRIALWRKAQRLPGFGSLIGWVHSAVRLPRLARRLRALEARVYAGKRREHELAAGWDARIATLEGTLALAAADRTKYESVAVQLSETLKGIDALQREREALKDAIVRIDQTLETRSTAIEAALVGASKSLAQDLTRTTERVNRLDAGAGDQAIRLAGLADSLAPIITLHEREQFSAEESTSLEGFYDGLEARFRGDRANIMTRFTPYLDFLRDAGVGTADVPLIDLGCGRGEWLELLKLNNLHAYGIDASQTAVDHCRAHGLSAERADVLTYLRGTPSEAFGAVSAMHIVEHLSFKTLVQLIREIRRVLIPGGLMLFETPNPENLFVAAYAFRMDPTHRVPLPPPMLEYLVESQGFETPTVLRLNAGAYGNPFAAAPVETASSPDAPPSITSLLRTVLEQNLYSAPDFGVIGRKPGGTRPIGPSTMGAASQADQ